MHLNSGLLAHIVQHLLDYTISFTLHGFTARRKGEATSHQLTHEEGVLLIGAIAEKSGQGPLVAIVEYYKANKSELDGAHQQN